MSDCLAEAFNTSFLACYSEMEKVEDGVTKTYLMLDHACSAPSDTYTAPADDPACCTWLQ